MTEIKPVWIQDLNCPFCGMRILSCYDINEIPDNTSEDEKEKEINYWCSAHKECGHLAFYDDYGFQGPEIKERYKEELEIVSDQIADNNEFMDLSDWLYGDDPQNLENQLKDSFPNYHIKIVRRQFDIGGGGKCNEGNPDILLLFLKGK